MKDEKVNFLIRNVVDVNKAIENTIDFETYDELLIDFCDTFVQEVNKFNAFKVNGDMVNYEIIVHALKSNFRTLGFMSTGEMFYQHELASKQNNINYVNEHYDELVNEVNRVYKILTEYRKMV